MSEPVSSPVAPAPSAPQPAAAPQQPQGPKRARLSEMDIGLEQANERMDRAPLRAVEPQQPAQLPVEPPEAPLAPEQPAEGDIEPQAPVDEQQAQQAAADQELFEKFQAWKLTGEAPEELNAFPLEWVDKNGNLVRETIQGLKERGMRLSDYHREMGGIRQQQQEMQVVKTNINKFFDDIRDPVKFLEEFENRDYDDTIEKVALAVAKRKTEWKQIAEAAGYRVMQQHNLPGNHPDVVGAVRSTMQALQRNFKTEVANRRLQQQNAQLAQVRQQHDQQAGQQQRMQQLGSSLAQLIPTAFKSVGVRHNAANEQDFYRHLNSYVATLPNWDGEIRRKHCLAAAQMVREELEDRAASSRPKPQPKPAAAKALPPGRMGQPGTAQPTTPQRKRVSDMGSDDRFGFG